jgi:stage III sporulation protein SpoIIIAA
VTLAQKYTPETLIIDEIGTRQEVSEAVGVKQRGVQLIATTHGRTLADVILNPHLRDLLGCVNEYRDFVCAGTSRRPLCQKDTERASHGARL